MADLKSKRLGMRLSQSELARLAHVSRWRLWASEHGSCTLTPDEEDRIQEALRREAVRLNAVFQNIDVAGVIRA
jgi:hypothetical protein